MVLCLEETWPGQFSTVQTKLLCLEHIADLEESCNAASDVQRFTKCEMKVERHSYIGT
jgi:hypothetical protein